jgi:hypothetical protein
MGKNRRKRPRPASATEPNAVSVPGGWKSVSVQLSHEEGVSGKIVVDDDGGHDHVEDRDMTGDVEEYTGNHYDDPKLSRKAEKDLPMNRGEDCAMFCSLEVLDASQYRVETKGAFKRLIINGGGEAEEAATAVALPDDNAKVKPQKGSGDETKTNTGDDKPSETKDSSISEPKKKKRKKKKKKDRTTTEDGEDPVQDKKALSTEKKSPKPSQERKPIPSIELEPISPDEVMKLQLSWSSSSGGAHLHNTLIESLHRLGFDSPTPIQAATLAASTMGRRNLVGAAPTGSGKTLAFLLPILNSILMEKNEGEEKPPQEDDDNDDAADALTSNKLQALIMTPTRGKSFRVCFVCEMCLFVKYYIDDDDNIMLTLLEYHKFEGRSLKR